MKTKPKAKDMELAALKRQVRVLERTVEKTRSGNTWLISACLEVANNQRGLRGDIQRLEGNLKVFIDAMAKA